LKGLKIAGLVLAFAAPVMPAHAGQSVSLILNWTPAADHSPFYYAKAQGWYEKAGIDLSIEVGKGSGVSSLKVGSGGAPFGIADLATMLVARGKGADAVALMSIYANTGQTFYWLKSYGVNGPKDFAGRKIGNPPGDASRVMDYQIWCGPAMGAFNEWTRGTFLEKPENRRVVVVGQNLLYGAALALRRQYLRVQGIQLPTGVLEGHPLDPQILLEVLNPEVLNP